MSVEGSAEAFSQIYQEQNEMVFNYIRSKVRRPEDAEDLTMKVFTNAWFGMESYVDEGRPISRWLMRMAKNAVIDHYRALRPNVGLDAVYGLESREISPEDFAQTRDLAQSLAEAMRQLPMAQRRAFWLKFIKGIPNDVVSQTMGVRGVAVRMHQMRARHTLRSAIQELDQG